MAETDPSPWMPRPSRKEIVDEAIDGLKSDLAALTRPQPTAAHGLADEAIAGVDILDLIGRLADDAGLCRERSVQCRKIGDTNGAETASQICDDLDEVCWLLRHVAVQRGLAALRSSQPREVDELRGALQPLAASERRLWAERIADQFCLSDAGAVDAIEEGLFRGAALRSSQPDTREGFAAGIEALDEELVYAIGKEVADGCAYKPGSNNHTRVWLAAQLGVRAYHKRIEAHRAAKEN